MPVDFQRTLHDVGVCVGLNNLKHVYSLCEHMFTHRVIVYSVQCQWKMKETYTSRGKMRFSRSHLPQNNVAYPYFSGFLEIRCISNNHLPCESSASNVQQENRILWSGRDRTLKTQVFVLFRFVYRAVWLLVFQASIVLPLELYVQISVGLEALSTFLTKTNKQTNKNTSHSQRFIDITS